jgi:hypothetical protein
VQSIELQIATTRPQNHNSMALNHAFAVFVLRGFLLDFCLICLSVLLPPAAVAIKTGTPGRALDPHFRRNSFCVCSLQVARKLYS